MGLSMQDSVLPQQLRPAVQERACACGRFVVAATHSKTMLLLAWLGPVTVAGSLGTPVLTIGAQGQYPRAAWLAAQRPWHAYAR